METVRGFACLNYTIVKCLVETTQQISIVVGTNVQETWFSLRPDTIDHKSRYSGRSGIIDAYNAPLPPLFFSESLIKIA